MCLWWTQADSLYAEELQNDKHGQKYDILGYSSIAAWLTIYSYHIFSYYIDHLHYFLSKVQALYKKEIGMDRYI